MDSLTKIANDMANWTADKPNEWKMKEWIHQIRANELRANEPNSVLNLQRCVVDWADNIIPDRKPSQTLIKLLQEVAELFENPTDPGEAADLMILVLDYFHLIEVDIVGAVVNKMGVNLNRNWKTDPKSGILSHIKTDIPCQAIQTSDQMICPCGNTWDVNDSGPSPKCRYQNKEDN